MRKSPEDNKGAGAELTAKQRSFADLVTESSPLLRVAGDGIFATYRLEPGRELIIGRGEDADVHIDDSIISRRHARVRTGPPVSIEDLGSSNGTRLGGRRLAAGEIVALDPGEVVVVGGTMLVVLPAGAEAEPTLGSRGRAPMPTVPFAGPAPQPASIVVRAPVMVELYQLVDRVAASAISVLLLGETGVGKEVMAETLHARSPRAARPFLRLNCAALSESLLESELFGHERGAFTGAVQAKPGLLETADEGTVFIDEAGEMPMPLQVKLLRVIEERQVTRVGGLRSRAIDVRFIAATNRDLEAEVERGAFRRDLYFRLNGISITIPPLRERLPELEGLAQHFLAQISRKLGRATPLRLSLETVARLREHAWSGNIRELRNVIERAAVLCATGVITPEQLMLDRAAGGLRARQPTLAPQAPEATPMPGGSDDARIPAASASLRENVEVVERRRIIEALERCAGNQSQAARQLGISRGTLLARIEQYGLPRPRGRKADG